MFNSKTSIRNKILEAVEEKIKGRQELLDDELKRLEEQLELDKAQAVETAVSDILSKLNL